MASFSYTLGTTAVIVVVEDSATGDITPITDICADGLSVLISEYANSPRLKSFICGVLTPLQEVEDTINNLLTLTLDIDLAEGVQLDTIGSILGELRGGRADVAYRRGLRTRVRVNRSEGQHSDFVKIVQLWVTTGNLTIVKDFYPASTEVGTPNYNEDPVGLNLRLQAAKAAAVRLQYVYGFATSGFELSGTYNTLETSAQQGLGSTHTTTGGKLSGVLE